MANPDAMEVLDTDGCTYRVRRDAAGLIVAITDPSSKARTVWTGPDGELPTDGRAIPAGVAQQLNKLLAKGRR